MIEEKKNGNSCGRVPEVTPEGETVWKHIEQTPRSYRYPYDYCPQSAALGKPEEVSVTPSVELRIEADKPLS